MKYLIDFSEASDRADAGGKGYGLNRLTNWRLNVPPGLVLKTLAYDEMILSLRVSELLEADGTAAVRDAIHNLTIWPELSDELEQSWRLLSDRYEAGLRVSCRSSATAEDSATASFAGQFATVLGVAGPDHVAEAVKQCWASVWSDEALAYRAAADIDHDEVSMAVVIQQMVRAKSSGVAFSVNPVTGDNAEIMINSNWGLGETVVSGLVTPDMFLVQKPDMTISLREISQTKTIRHVVAEDGSIEEQSVNGVEAVSPSITDAQVSKIARLAMLAEESAGSPQDIEWAYEAGELFVLQTRPITTA